MDGSCKKGGKLGRDELRYADRQGLCLWGTYLLLSLAKRVLLRLIGRIRDDEDDGRFKGGAAMA